MNPKNFRPKNTNATKGAIRGKHLLTIYDSDFGNYLSSQKLFTAHYEVIPHIIQERCIDCTAAIAWVRKTYKQNIWDQYTRTLYAKYDDDAPAEDEVYILLYDNFLINFETYKSAATIYYKETPTELVDEINSGIRTFRKPPVRFEPTMGIIMAAKHGLEVNNFKLNDITLDLNSHYNDDFKPVHTLINRRLNAENDKGIVLLHGKAGTGKTSYIRYLIGQVNKKVLFIPPNLAGVITNPELITLLTHNPNSILVIEDAETLIMDRNKNGSSAVSALLNLSDGLLSDCLNIQIICSFNTQLSKVDPALLRKGRLIARYEFKELQTAKANTLSRQLGYPAQFTSPQTLTAIFNQSESEFAEKSRAPIGFK